MEYATEETVTLSPIPCWEHLPAEEYLERICGLVEEVEEEAAADREKTGIPALGPEVILAQDPQHRPKKLDRSPASFVHAATKAARQALYQSYSWSVDEQAEARRQATGVRLLGIAAVLAQNPLHRPGKIKKSPAPFVHAATKAMRQLLWEGYALFVASLEVPGASNRALRTEPGNSQQPAKESERLERGFPSLKRA